MTQSRIQQLKDITELSRHMLTAAQADDWSKVAALELQRQESVHACFSQAVAKPDSAAVAQIIQEILQLNQSVLALSQQAKGQLGEQISTHATGKAAKNAYLACSSSP